MLEKLKTKTVVSDDSDKKWGFQAWFDRIDVIWTVIS